MEHNFSFSVPSSLFAGIFVKFMKIEMVEQHQPSSNSPAEAACIIKEECIKWDFKLSHLTGSSNSNGSSNCNCNSAGHYK